MEDLEKDAVAVSPDETAVQTAEPKPAPITGECIGYEGHQCGKTFVKRSNVKRCPECLAVVASPEWKQRENNQRVKKGRADKKTREESQFGRYDNREEINLKEVPDLLTERGITTPCVRDAILRFGQATAGVLGLVANKYYWLKGTTNLQARIAKEEPPAAPGDDYPEGELLTRKNLHTLYEHCAEGRIICGQEMTFDEWLATRLRAKTDLWFLCVNVAGKGLVEATHRDMVDFFVKKNPRYLSEIVAVKGEYDQEDVKSSLLRQDTQHDRLLLYPRSMYKSTVNVLDCTQWQLNCPDLRIAVQTSTLPLGKLFLSELKKYFSIRSTSTPSNLQALFPEMTMLGTEKGSETTFKNPAARLDLKEPSCWNIAADSDNAVGMHNDLLVDDDYVSPINSNTPEARDKLAEKFFLSGETLDRPWGFRTTIGTRYCGSDSPDVYGRLIDLNEQVEGDLKILVRGAWTVLPHAVLKKITELTVDDVSLLFPIGPNGEEGKGSFKVLRRKLISDERTFRQQQLNEAVDDQEDGVKLNFDRDVLDRNVIQIGQAKSGKVVISCDIAYSQNKFADNTAISVIKLYPNEQGEMSMCVLTLEASRMRMSEVANRLVMLTRTYNPETVLIAKSPTYDLIQSEITRESRKYQTSVPIFWAPVDTQKNSKWLRLKHLEILLHQGRLKFVSGTYIEDLFKELIKLNECVGKMIRSSSSRHDDRADSLSLAQKFFLPAITPDGEEDEEDVKKIIEDQMKEARRKAQYLSIFGTNTVVRQQDPEPEQDSAVALFRGLGSNLRRR